jgi:hypothetical protein
MREMGKSMASVLNTDHMERIPSPWPQTTPYADSYGSAVLSNTTKIYDTLERKRQAKYRAFSDDCTSEDHRLG